MSSPRPTQKAQILVADDHPMVRSFLTELINRESDLTVCGEAADGQQTLAAIARLKPDLVILDLSMPHSHGTDLIRDIHHHHPDLRVLVLSTHAESLYAERALRAGARGYITKQAAGDQIKVAIRRVLAGQVYLSPTVADQVLNKTAGQQPTAPGLDALSDRELEIFRLLGRGSGPTQIASELHLSVKSVETYLARIKEKLGVKSAADLYQHAILFNKLHD